MTLVPVLALNDLRTLNPRRVLSLMSVNRGSKPKSSFSPGTILAPMSNFRCPSREITQDAGNRPIPLISPCFRPFQRPRFLIQASDCLERPSFLTFSPSKRRKCAVSCGLNTSASLQKLFPLLNMEMSQIGLLLPIFHQSTD